MATKQEVLKAHLTSWLRAKGDKKKRGEITRLVSQSLGMHPKSIPRAFRRIQLKTESSARCPGRPRVYGNDVIAALKDVWELGDRCCGELLHPMIREYVHALQRYDAWHHTEETTQKLFAMGFITVKRRTRGLQKKHGLRRGISSTKPSSLKSTIPIFKGPWKDLPPGNGQLDTVAHCGDTLRGDHIYSVNYTDIPTYWVVFRSQWNKGQYATRESIKAIRARMPFPLLMGHPDGGSEFINYVLKDWFDAEGIDLTRSEPGKKNDNMCVEERNGHVVRKYLGYARLNVPEVVPVMNAFYEYLALYLNHFKAVRRQVLKEKVGSKYVRRYEKTAKTPYQRVLEHSEISEEIKQLLREEHEQLNPLQLKKEIDRLRSKIHNIQKTARKRKSDAS